MSNDLLVLPRPGAPKPAEKPSPLPPPSEAAFVEAFGQLLPPASYLQTATGKAAYYELEPTSPPTAGTPIARVLFVHGIQTCAIGLQPLASALSARFPHAKIVLFDNWGHGLTETPIESHDVSLFHGLIEALLDHLGWPDAHFVGYSFGAATTASFVASRPERVASMVLVAPSGFIRTAQFTEEQKGYVRGGEGLEEKAKAGIMELLEGGELVVPSDWKERVNRGEMVPEAVRDWQLKNHPGHAASVIAIFRDGGPLDNEESFVKAVKTKRKCQVILGANDDLSCVKDFNDVGMDDVAVVPDAGHGVVRDRVPEVAQIIEQFWKQL